MDRRQCVLIVDDDELVRETHISVLAREPVDVAIAESGAAALAYLADHRVDTILLDVMMPDMDGFETCRRIKANPRTAPIPVIIVTALDAPDDLVRGLESGAEEFVSKPVNRNEMRARVRSMLRVKRQYDALLVMNERLGLLQRQRATLSAFLVHDLKSPLSVILTNADICQDDALPVDVREAGADIAASARTMDGMVMDLLDVARADEEGLVLHREALRAGDLCVDVLASLRSLITSRQIRVEIVGDESATITVDRDLFRRIMTNLLDNGLKYAPLGSTIQIELTLAAGRFVLRQRDLGVGVPAALREHIFDRFVRAEAHRDVHSRESRGLGLAFCKLAVEAHGGRIWVEDNAPRGTVFCVSIPQTAPAPAPGG